jgi:deoxyribodipyrimidine photo-lyase
MTDSPVIFWFREDLRLQDNPGLRAAVDSGQPVICLYILEEQFEPSQSMGDAALWWLHHSLSQLEASVSAAGGSLVLRRGDARKILPTVQQETGASAVYWNRRYGPAQIDTDKQLKSELQAVCDVHSFNGRLLFEPWAIQNKTGQPYRVFTPMWKEMQKHTVRDLITGIRKIHGATHKLASDNLDDWGLLPTKPNWAAAFPDTWSPGEDGAHERLKDFLDGAVASYKDDRNRPDMENTSRLSPHLQMGEISPVQIWHQTQQKMAEGGVPENQAMVFLSEIAWREFSYSLLFHNPDMLREELNPKFKAFPWTQDNAKLTAWQKGQTGYPIVDAGMRQLWQTGWMHNRVRMIVGSFLVKHLLLDWRDGMAWFWDTLVDADIASNAASWQWIAGCGADAAPYFRIFNPMTQGENFDPDGTYIRTYVQELKDVPAKYIHQPWEAPENVLKESGVTIGDTYPKPIVDHGIARARALDAYEKTK